MKVRDYQDMTHKDIKNFTLKELVKEVVKLGYPSYRAGQIFCWLYQRGIANFSQMANIPKALRDRLNQNYYIDALKLSRHFKSADGTEKFLFGLFDGNFIETVLIYAKNRRTICLSTQVGCRFSCSFCASGRIRFVRNLAASELISQILYLQHNFKHKINNYVFMGIGEPLDNCENVLKAIMIMNEPAGMDMGAGRITISTCGLIPGIEKLKDSRLKVGLSVSLHAGNNKLRDQLMPINKKYPLEKLIKACRDYIDTTGRTITLEYILIKGKNDSLQDIDMLASICKKLNSKINLIPCSIIPNLDFQPPAKESIKNFIKGLLKRGINVRLRESKGKDIQAACGQLTGNNVSCKERIR